uniref:Uncharacterized protein n=1 Tax=Palpitomonas bilix TaxID=652834 RepID=A0A7S3D594_9EUKA|mmetsp:Transcript_22712/g.57864  ORF Transcript_22712/g.57864 Transcript_22712/m.57864 type:complete len:264 (+) Transcript_22712:251-1042(+)
MSGYESDHLRALRKTRDSILGKLKKLDQQEQEILEKRTRLRKSLEDVDALIVSAADTTVEVKTNGFRAKRRRSEGNESQSSQITHITTNMEKGDLNRKDNSITRQSSDDDVCHKCLTVGGRFARDRHLLIFVSSSIKRFWVKREAWKNAEKASANMYPAQGLPRQQPLLRRLQRTSGSLLLSETERKMTEEMERSERQSICLVLSRKGFVFILVFQPFPKLLLPTLLLFFRLFHFVVCDAIPKEAFQLLASKEASIHYLQEED